MIGFYVMHLRLGAGTRLGPALSLLLGRRGLLIARIVILEKKSMAPIWVVAATH